MSRRGTDGDGYLEIDIQRHDEEDPSRVRLASGSGGQLLPRLGGVSRRLYSATQSHIHVISCNYFLRRLVRRDLSASKVGHFAGPPRPSRPPDPS